MRFSLLMSVYKKENVAYFIDAMESILHQTRMPNEIILVKDGPLTQELEEVIQKYQANYPDLLKVLSLPKNVGLGSALNQGLELCRFEFVARMDTDDIAHPKRFEKQLNFLQQHPQTDVLGSWICEFETIPDMPFSFRKPPLQHPKILSYAQYSNPINHMSVIFRKHTIIDAGNYQPMDGMEDYYLWVRVIQKGGLFANIPEILIYARTGISMIARRQGIDYFKKEIYLQQKFLNIGYISYPRFFLNLLIRALPRLFPISILNIVYKISRKIF